jgi:threonine/homoserine/homoserine lactone efflux protein
VLADSALLGATLLNGFVLGWSVSWPPGPVNAEMIRRGLLPQERGGGFWPAWQVGLGACGGDFLWAFGVATGAGVVIGRPALQPILAAISFAILLLLATIYAVGAWRSFRGANATSPKPETAPPKRSRTRRGSLLLGFVMAITSPWNLGFWLAVIGGQQANRSSGPIFDSLALAISVVLGAASWTVVLCVAVKSGARVFARPGWQIATQVLTALVMIWFAVKVAVHFR